MTIDEARTVFLSFPDTFESEHGGHPDFRISGKGIFATLWPDKGYAVLRLPPEVAEERGQVVSRYGGMAWLRFDLEPGAAEELQELAEIAWHMRAGRH